MLELSFFAMSKLENIYTLISLFYFDLLTRPKMPFQGDAPEGGDTF